MRVLRTTLRRLKILPELLRGLSCRWKRRLGISGAAYSPGILRGGGRRRDHVAGLGHPPRADFLLHRLRRCRGLWGPPGFASPTPPTPGPIGLRTSRPGPPARPRGQFGEHPQPESVPGTRAPQQRAGPGGTHHHHHRRRSPAGGLAAPPGSAGLGGSGLGVRGRLGHHELHQPAGGRRRTRRSREAAGGEYR